MPLFNSAQRFTYDVLGNIVTISINQEPEPIHPVDKDCFDHFDSVIYQNFILCLIYFIFPIIFSPVKFGFPPTERRSWAVQYPRYMVAAACA
jgi:hypothetical protein